MSIGANKLPSLNALRAFEVTGRHLNFRKASEEMGVTAGAISQQVRKLESELGTALFYRETDGLSFTAQGRSYHSKIIGIFEELRQATQLLLPSSGHVTISVTPTVASKWLIPRLPEFTAKHPNIDVRIIATERVLSFRNEPIDLAIRQTASRIGSGVRAEVLFRQELIAVCSPQLLSGLQLPLGDEQIAQLPLLHDATDLWAEFLSQEEEDASRPLKGVRLGATGLCLDAALAHQGIALTSRFLVAKDLADRRLVQVTPRSLLGPETYYLLRRKDVSTSASIDIFHKWLLTHRSGDSSHSEG